MKPFQRLHAARQKPDAQPASGRPKPALHLVPIKLGLHAPERAGKSPVSEQQELEPRDPVAYPTHPTRIAGAARPVYHLESAAQRDEVVSLPVRSPRRAAVAAPARQRAAETVSSSRRAQVQAQIQADAQTTATGEGYVTHTIA